MLELLLGGAAAGETLLYTANPILAGAVGGGTTTLVGQGLEKATGKEKRSWGEIATNTIGGTAGGALGGVFFGGSGGLVIRSALARATGGATSTATSEVLQKVTGIKNRSFSDIFNDTKDSAIMGGITGGITGGIIKAANSKLSVNSKNNAKSTSSSKNQILTAEEIANAIDVDYTPVGETLPVKAGTNSNLPMTSVKALTNISVPKTGMLKVDLQLFAKSRTGVGNLRNGFQSRIDNMRTKMPTSKLKNKGNMATANVDISGLKSEYFAHSKINSATDIGADVADFSYLKNSNDRIFSTYEEVGYPRYHDTEAKILEDIASNIKNSNMAGNIDLYTELPACQSCTNVIMEFRRMFPNIRLNVHTK